VPWETEIEKRSECLKFVPTGKWFLIIDTDEVIFGEMDREFNKVESNDYHLCMVPLMDHQLKKENWVELQVWNTGQHYDYEMSKIFEEELDIHPDLNFGVGSGSPMEQLTKIMVESEKALVIYKPDLVIVIGDTNSTLGATLAAKKLNIPIAHIEAGVREQVFDGRHFHRKLSMLQFPEEINRVIVDNCSDILFAPTENAVKNLRKENILGKIVLTGDIGCDILSQNIPSSKINLEPYNLVTLHRTENTDYALHLKEIVNALIESKTPIIFPIHPRTRKAMESIGLINLLIKNPKIRVCEPVGYREMINLMYNAQHILTDSGGIQREAYLLKVPCLTLRRNTVWVETIRYGANKLIEYKDIANELEKTPSFPSKIRPIFGDGKSTFKIVKYIKKWYYQKIKEKLEK
jgi:UDP-N-acetylglucosamine 2-epimerase